MVTFKKAGVLLSAAALSVGLLAPTAGATTLVDERMESLPIKVAQTDSKVTKNDLIKRLKELFPNEFKNLKNKDFRMETGYYQPNDQTVRYSLSVSKDIDNQYVYGNFVFVGESLELEHFYYKPLYTKDVFFPAKVSKDEAQKVADQLIEKLDKGEGYQLVPNEYYYYSSSMLTEPIEYNFTYMKKKSGVPISDQMVQIGVLGNGTVTFYDKTESKEGNLTYDDPSKVQKEAIIANRLQDALKAQLSYKIETDFRTDKYTAKLVYQPNNEVTTGIHAQTGRWLTSEGLTQTLPNQVITPIVSEPLPAKYSNISVKQAQAIAEELLAIDQKGVQLKIESIGEITTETGKSVYEVSYMYEMKNGGAGGYLTIDKATGEVISYHNMRNELVPQEDDQAGRTLTQQQCLEKAIAYVKQWIPSYAHQYALPTVNDISYEEYSNGYYVSFPRIVNGLSVIGDQIVLSVDAQTGDLLYLYVNSYDNLEWPEITDLIPQEEATKLLKDELKLKLQYVNHPKVENEHHYSLVYQPSFRDGVSMTIDAKTGEWLDLFGRVIADKPTIEHPTAEEELNYLIQAGILEIDETFNPDAAVTKEDALKVLLKSFTYMYYGYYDEELTSNSFADISEDHPLYPFVTYAIKMGMLDKSSKEFNGTELLTNQELAKWSIAIMNLDKAAQYSHIYKLDYSDAAKVDKDLRGHVALAYAMGILEAQDNRVNPKNNVSYADLAQITIRIAHKLIEFENGLDE